MSSPIHDRRRKPWTTRLALAAGALLLAPAVLACGSDIEAERAPDMRSRGAQVQTEVTPVAPATEVPDPASEAPAPAGWHPSESSRFIAIVDGSTGYAGSGWEARFYDPTTGSLLGTQEILGPRDYSLPTNANGDEPELEFSPMQMWEVAGDFTWGVGVDVYPGGDRVPAKIDFGTGRVADLVTPNDPTQFATAAPVTYSSSVISPTDESVWAVQDLASPENGFKLGCVLKNLTSNAKYRLANLDEMRECPSLDFIQGQAMPILTARGAMSDIVYRVWNGTSFTTTPPGGLYVTSPEDLARQTSLALNPLVHTWSPDGPAAFTAGTPENREDLYTVLPGQEPHRVATNIGGGFIEAFHEPR
jgi:hypothetical protein